MPAWDSFVVLKEMYEVEESKFRRRVDHLIEALQLTDKVNTQVRKLSLGERNRNANWWPYCFTHLSIVFLDEPTIGLDVVSQMRDSVICAFQRKTNTNSNRKRTLVPTESEHRFQSKANSDSNRKRTPREGGFGLA